MPFQATSIPPATASHPWGESWSEKYAPSVRQTIAFIDAIPPAEMQRIEDDMRTAIAEKDAIPGKILKAALGAVLSRFGG